MASQMAENRQTHQLIGKAADILPPPYVSNSTGFQRDQEMMDEREIIRDIKAGDTQSYAQLVEKYHRSLLAYIFKMVGDRDMVEDIGQEVFFTVYRSLRRFDENRGVPFSAWLFTVARNHCITVLRQKRTERRRGPEGLEFLEDGRKNPEEHIVAREQMAAVAASLQQIPELFRKTIVMSLEGDSLEDIAASHGISLGTVKSRLFRAKERMKLLVRFYFGCNEI